MRKARKEIRDMLFAGDSPATPQELKAIRDELKGLKCTCQWVSNRKRIRSNVCPIHKNVKIHFGLRIDRDVLEWFRAKGKGFTTLMNSALRFYMESKGA